MARTKTPLRVTRQGWFFGMHYDAGESFMMGAKLISFPRMRVLWFGPYATYNQALAGARGWLMPAGRTLGPLGHPTLGSDQRFAPAGVRLQPFEPERGLLGTGRV